MFSKNHLNRTPLIYRVNNHQIKVFKIINRMTTIKVFKLINSTNKTYNRKILALTLMIV